MVNKETAPTGRPRAPKETVNELMGVRKKLGGLQKGAIAVTGAGVLVAGALAGHQLYKGTLPETYERKNPAMEQAAWAGDFHRYDWEAFKTHPALKKLWPVVSKHRENIEKVAGKDYNILTVIETLTRTPGSAEEAKTAVKINEWANDPRMSRRADIITRAAALPNANAMFRDLYSLPSRNIKNARDVFYGEKVWEYGKLRSGIGPATKPVQKDQSFKRQEQKERSAWARSHQARNKQPRSALIRHQQYRRV